MEIHFSLSPSLSVCVLYIMYVHTHTYIYVYLSIYKMSQFLLWSVTLFIFK